MTELPSKEEILSAIKETEYKYFGDYEFSEKQWDAVSTLVKVANFHLDNTRAAVTPDDKTAALERIYGHYLNNNDGDDFESDFQTIRAALQQQDESDLVKALEGIIACFDGAVAEGLPERMSEEINTDPGSLHDLITRRIYYAYTFATEAMNTHRSKVK